MSRIRWVGILLIGAFCQLPAFGQTGAIQGTLSDPQGAAIAGAKVSAVEETKNVIVRQTVSERDGSFRFPQLLPGIPRHSSAPRAKSSRRVIRGTFSLD
jgi:hypothetical protein